MSYLIKALLITSPVQFFRNVENTADVVAQNITITNITPGPVYIFLSIRGLNESFETGCIMYNYKIDANQRVEINHPRILQVDDVIEGYSSHSFEASISIDIVGALGRYVDLPKAAPPILTIPYTPPPE